MTCIVGLVHEGSVWIGGDSAGVGGLDMTVRADPKVFRNGPFIIGCTSSFRMRDLLQYTLVPPERNGEIMPWMVNTVIPLIRTCLKDGGFASKNNETEEGGTFLIGYQGRLFFVGNDYQLGIPTDGFIAVGCGDQIAHGALYATSGDPEERVRTALLAAERFSAGVRGPFVIMEGK